MHCKMLLLQLTDDGCDTIVTDDVSIYIYIYYCYHIIIWLYICRSQNLMLVIVRVAIIQV